MRPSETDTLLPPAGGSDPEPSTIWVLVVVGWLFASLSVVGLRPPGAGAPATALTPVEVIGDEPPGPRRAPGPPLGHDPGAAPSTAGVDLQRSPPRELRRLPGIGPVRAAAIAEWRWRTGGAPFALSEVHGIGPRIEARALRALADAPAGEPGVAGGLPHDGLR